MTGPRSLGSVAELASAVARRERRALAKAITLVESSLDEEQQSAQRLLEALLERTGGAIRLGVTGVPGVGKSTFIEALGLLLVGGGRRVAVLAVDPSSALSGGSILGDKTRMPRLAAADSAFIRPSPSRGALGGVARRTREAVLLCEAAGYDVVIVETVGVGQSEFAVASMVDFFLALMLAGAGDELQGIKRGIMELVDGLVIHKADGDNLAHAGRAAAEYAAALRLLRSHDEWTPPVLTASAVEGTGIREVWAAVEAHHRQMVTTGRLEAKRKAQQQQWFWSQLEEGIRRHVLGRPEVERALRLAEQALGRGEVTPTQAARSVLSVIDG